jgi:hypothetical protein
MKKYCLLLLICFIAATVSAQYSAASYVADAVTEKRYLSLKVGQELFLIDSTNGDLWRLDTEEPYWLFVGSPRGADSERKGTYKLEVLFDGKLLVLNTDSGDAWLTDGVSWKAIDDPDDRDRRRDRD